MDRGGVGNGRMWKRGDRIIVVCMCRGVGGGGDRNRNGVEKGTGKGENSKSVTCKAQKRDREEPVDEHGGIWTNTKYNFDGNGGI